MRDDEGRVVAREATDDANHLWVEGLAPSTTYRYQVLVDGEPWGGTLIDHLALYPTAGNHDGSDEEDADDRGQLEDSMQAQIDRLVPLYRRGGARLLLHGHEHNFQHGRVDGLDYIVSGAGGKLDERPPRATAAAGTRSWAAAAHCLLVHATPDALTVVPYGVTPPGGQPVPLVRRRPDGSPVDEPIVVRPG